jgi:hypothetical protein
VFLIPTDDERCRYVCTHECKVPELYVQPVGTPKAVMFMYGDLCPYVQKRYKALVLKFRFSSV